MSPDSAVSPTLRQDGSTLTLAYYLPGCDDSAVVQFSGVSAWYYGYPNDEGLQEYPLWGRGLTFYNFHQVVLPENEECWIATFHNGTFEVRARQTLTLAACVQGSSPAIALNTILGAGSNKALD